MSVRMFPIMHGVDILWEVIAPFEKQAQINHGQSLERLAQRGGLGECEAVAVLEQRKWHRMDETEARKQLREIAEAHANSPLSVARRELETLRAENATLRAKLAVWESNIKDA